MSNIISAKIDLSKIPESAIFVGAKGRYIDITLLLNRNGTDQYGNDYLVVLDLGKDARLRGEKGPILGNGRIRGQQGAPAPKPAPKPAPREQMDGDPGEPAF